ncbi:MAG: ATP:cob(I)alamin adenosyltransferase [Turicibacter sp.]|nr:ATP:cob(I)alamin adenosyltransferase [Turicibacter sp.]
MSQNWDLIAYPFLNEKSRLVDHEVLTDQLSSTLGMICSLDPPLKDETWWLMEMTLHINGSIRGRLAISEEDLVKGLDLLHVLKERNKERLNRFVYPTGHVISSWYHIARCQAKQVVRNLYLLEQEGIEIPQIVIDFSNLIANLLFAFSVEVNAVFEIDEREFVSKSY